MEGTSVRIGIVGAGAVFYERHLPNLVAMKDVSVVAIASGSATSARAAAERFGIAAIESNWQRLVARADIDAVMIGTPPDLQRPISVAALEAGKHVFCEPPMGLHLADAIEMLGAANRFPNQVSMICRSERRSPYDGYIRSIIQSGELGAITAVDVLHTSGSRTQQHAGWREQVERSGRLTLALDSYAEVLNAWVCPYASLSAVATTPIAEKRDTAGQPFKVKVPQIVMVLGILENGAAGVEYHGGLSPDLTTPRDLVTIYGIKGVLRYYFDAREIRLASIGRELKTVEVPAKFRQEARAESDFVTAIRRAKLGASWSVGSNLSFREGVALMRKLEAVHIAAQTGLRVQLSAL